MTDYDKPTTTSTADQGWVGVLLNVSAPTRKGSRWLGKFNQSGLRWLLLFMLLGILGWYGWLRIWKIHTHATTIDDIGVANNYLLAEHSHSVDSLRIRLYTAGKSVYYRSTAYKALSVLDSWHLLEPGHVVVNYLFKAVATTRYTNYAPLQFVAGAWLVTGQETYNELKLWGRIPSAIASILLLALIPLVARRLSRNHFSTVPLLAMVLIACSWQQFFIARQMYPIAISGLALLILILRLTHICTYRLRHPNAVMEAIILTLLCLCNYQLFYFIPAYLVVLTLYANNTAPSSWRISHAIRTALYFGLMMTPFLLAFDLSTEAANHWNAGRWGEYHFSLPANGSWLDGTIYTLRFWSSNTVSCIAASLGFLPWGGGMMAMGYVWIAFAGLGLYYYAKTDHAITHGFALFVLVSIMTWVLMISLGIANLSPTRQTSIMAPILALLVANGFCISVRRLSIWAGFGHKQDALTLAVVTLVSGGIISGHTLYFKYMRYEWSDPFIGARQAINQMVRTYPTQLLIQCDWTLNGSLMWQPIKPFQVLTFNRLQDFSTSQTAPLLAAAQPATYCFVLSPTPPDDRWRVALVTWLRKQSLCPPDFDPVVVAQHQISRKQYIEYVPISSLNPVNSNVWVVQIRPIEAQP